MAYGVVDPADDWFKNGVYADPTFNKVRHDSLSGNLLTNHGDYCNRMAYATASGPTMGARFTYTNAAYDNSLWHSSRIFFRPGAPLDSGLPVLVPWVWVQYADGVGPTAVYVIGPWSTGGGTAQIDFGYRDMTTQTAGRGLARVIARSGNLSMGWAANDWFGMRLDCVRQGNDMRLTAYVVMGSTACDTLDANGEPDWVQCLDLSHINGSTTPTMYLGTALNTFDYSTPYYAGTSGFGVTTGSIPTASHTWLDSARIKQLT